MSAATRTSASWSAFALGVPTFTIHSETNRFTSSGGITVPFTDSEELDENTRVLLSLINLIILTTLLRLYSTTILLPWCLEEKQLEDELVEIFLVKIEVIYGQRFLYREVMSVIFALKKLIAVTDLV